MKKMRECLISSVRVSLINQDRIVVLKEKESERYSAYLDWVAK